MPRKKKETTALSPLDIIAAGIQAKFGPDSMRRLNTPGVYPDIRRVAQTGIPSFDTATGVGGLPFGKLIVVDGRESVGKTTLSKFLGGQFQLQGIVLGFLDAEQSGDAKWDAGMGLDLSRALGGQPTALEDVFLWLAEGMRLAVKAKQDMFFVWDSLAATLLRAENKRKLEDLGPPGERARYLSQKIKPLKVVLDAPGANVGLLIVNQVRENIGSGTWGEKWVSPGGQALKHYTDLHLRMTRIGQVRKGEGPATGIRSAIKVAKSRIAAPYGESIIEILFDPPELRESKVGKGSWD